MSVVLTNVVATAIRMFALRKVFLQFGNRIRTGKLKYLPLNGHAFRNQKQIQLNG